jgi:hypothetical protein
MMISRVVTGALVILVSACASKTRSYGRDDAKPAAEPTRADSLRARALAAAIGNPGANPSLAEGSGKLHFPIEAAQADEVGSVILAFTVLPSGRVDRESRTIIYLEGHPLFAQVACDFLLEARVSIERPKPQEPAFVTHAMTFQIRNQPKAQPVGARINDMMQRLRFNMLSRTLTEREAWLAARPSCSALKKRDM